MSGFILKLIAMLFMLIDHISADFTEIGIKIFDQNTLLFMRAMGRLSLPIFAFFIVEGYLKTSNIKKYIVRMHIVALISQVPFMLTFFFRLFKLLDLSKVNIIYDYSYLPIILAIIILYWYYILQKRFDYSLILISIVYLLIPISLKQNLILKNNLNIFYEFGFTLIVLYFIDKIILNNNRNIFERIALVLITIISIKLIGNYANYEMNAILLCIALYLTRNNKLLKLATILFWGYYMYSGYTPFFIFVLISVVLLFFYNEKKGYNLKYLFYIFYPLHLSILAILNMLIKK